VLSAVLNTALVSDIAVFVLKRDVNLQPTKLNTADFRLLCMGRIAPCIFVYTNELNILVCVMFLISDIMWIFITFRVRRRLGEMYIGHARLCVCLSRAAFSHYCVGLAVSYWNSRRCPLVVQYWADLQSVHWFRCYDNIAANAKCQQMFVLALCLVRFCVSRRRRKMYCGHVRLSVFVSVRVWLFYTLLHEPGCNLGEW